MDIEPGVLLCHEFDLLSSIEDLTNLYVDFDTTPASDLFSACHGFWVDDKSGNIFLRLEPADENHKPRFCKTDVKFIFKNYIRNLELAIQEEVQPNYCKFIPSVIKDYDGFLKTLLCAHSLTKDFLTNYVTNQFGVVNGGQNNEDENENILHTKIFSGTVHLTSSHTHDSYINYNFGNVDTTLALETRQPTADGVPQFLMLLANSKSLENFNAGATLLNVTSRLIEITKLIATFKHLQWERIYLEDRKNSIQMYLDNRPFEDMIPCHANYIKSTEEDILNWLMEFREEWKHMHPGRRENMVQNEWKRILSQCGLEYRENHLPSGEKDRILQQFRDMHSETDKYIVNSVSKRYNVLDTKVKLLIPSLLDMDTNALNKMKKLCCNGWAQREIDLAKNVIIGFEENGIPFDEHPIIENLDTSFGGVTLNPNIDFNYNNSEPDETIEKNPVLISLKSLLDLNQDEPLPTNDAKLGKDFDMMPYFYEEMGSLALKKGNARISNKALNSTARKPNNTNKLLKIYNRHKKSLNFSKFLTTVLCWI